MEALEVSEIVGVLREKFIGRSFYLGLCIESAGEQGLLWFNRGYREALMRQLQESGPFAIVGIRALVGQTHSMVWLKLSRKLANRLLRHLEAAPADNKAR